MKTFKYLSLSLALLLSAFTASAQRTMPGQIFVDASFAWPVSVRIGSGGYMIPGFWDAGVEALRMRKSLAREDEVLETHLDVWQLKAYGGYRHRLVSTRSRIFSLYGGGDAWVGVEVFDPFKKLPSDIVFNMSTDPSFVFGITPVLEMELFLGSHFAFVLGGRASAAFLTRMNTFSGCGYGGFRIAF